MPEIVSVADTSTSCFVLPHIIRKSMSYAWILKDSYVLKEAVVDRWLNETPEVVGGALNNITPNTQTQLLSPSS